MDKTVKGILVGLLIALALKKANSMGFARGVDECKQRVELASEVSKTVKEKEKES